MVSLGQFGLHVLHMTTARSSSVGGVYLDTLCNNSCKTTKFTQNEHPRVFSEVCVCVCVYVLGFLEVSDVFVIICFAPVVSGLRCSTVCVCILWSVLVLKIFNVRLS